MSRGLQAFGVVVGLCFCGSLLVPPAQAGVKLYGLEWPTDPSLGLASARGELWSPSYGSDGGGLTQITTAGSSKYYPFQDPRGRLEGISGLNYMDASGNWWTGNGSHILQISPTGNVLATYDYGTPRSNPTVGPDGNPWFLSQYEYSAAIESISSDGQVHDHGSLPAFVYSAEPAGFVLGPDGNFWYTDSSGSEPTFSKISKITLNNSFDRAEDTVQITEYSLPDDEAPPDGILTVGGNGFWFPIVSLHEPGERFNTINEIGSLSLDGTLREYDLPAGTNPSHVAYGPDGNIWFLVDGIHSRKKTILPSIARLIPNSSGGGTVTYYRIPRFQHGKLPLKLTSLVAGPDGALWFSACRTYDESECYSGVVGRLTTDTRGSSRPITTTSHVLEKVVIPARERKAIGASKVAAQTALPLIEQADTAMLALKITVAVADPEIALEVLIPDKWDVVEWLDEKALEKLAGDPPDPHFRQVDHPAIVGRPGHAHRRRARRPSVPQAWRAVLKSDVAAGRELRLMVRSVERLKGAAAAGRCKWVTRQNEAVRGYAANARLLYAGTALRIKRLRHALVADHQPKLKITRSQFERAQSEVAEHGLPRQMAKALTRAGATKADLSRAQASIVSSKPRAFGLLPALTVPMNQYARLSRALRKLSSTVSRPGRCKAHPFR